ncbi:MAG: gamma-glutamylcyclotransferase [Gemmatimonadaceae bacterium]|jgi:gamma-glutamylcyclotransferase (GGCT)/AIG2-like uncharacterized protein YtfP|nr:gamma-glutamylcyclotransferase [Gemmatimonadaceae bacterium]
MRPLPEHLFVYGTLRRGMDSPMRTRMERDTTVVGPATLRGQLYDAGWHPALVLDDAAESLVHGELVHLPHDKHRRRRLLSELDHYEGVLHGPAEHLSLFHRVIADALYEGVLHATWVYVYARDASRFTAIPDGTWRRA